MVFNPMSPESKYSKFILLLSSRTLIILMAWNIFVAWIKLFKYLSFNKTMTQLSGTLGAVSYIT